MRRIGITVLAVFMAALSGCRFLSHGGSEAGFDSSALHFEILDPGEGDVSSPSPNASSLVGAPVCDRPNAHFVYEPRIVAFNPQGQGRFLAWAMDSSHPSITGVTYSLGSQEPGGASAVAKSAQYDPVSRRGFVRFSDLFPSGVFDLDPSRRWILRLQFASKTGSAFPVVVSFQVDARVGALELLPGQPLPQDPSTAMLAAGNNGILIRSKRIHNGSDRAQQILYYPGASRLHLRSFLEERGSNDHNGEVLNEFYSDASAFLATLEVSRSGLSQVFGLVEGQWAQVNIAPGEDLILSWRVRASGVTCQVPADSTQERYRLNGARIYGALSDALFVVDDSLSSQLRPEFRDESWSVLDLGGALSQRMESGRRKSFNMEIGAADPAQPAPFRCQGYFTP